MNRQQKDILGFAGWSFLGGVLLGWEARATAQAFQRRRNTKRLEVLEWTPKKEAEMKAFLDGRRRTVQRQMFTGTDLPADVRARLLQERYNTGMKVKVSK
jgi:hypothetical protein